MGGGGELYPADTRRVVWLIVAVGGWWFDTETISRIGVGKIDKILDRMLMNKRRGKFRKE